MSDIDSKIKYLLRLKTKIGLYTQLSEFISTLKDQKELKDHPGLLDEFKSEMNILISDQIKLVENNGQVAPGPQSMVDSLQSTVDHKPSAPAPIVKPKPTIDPITFLREHKHLEGKEVIVMSKDGDVAGKVVGMNPPMVVVETVTGFRISIEPEKLK